MDLTTANTYVHALRPEDAERCIGGSGLAARLIAEEVAAGPDPLGPDNPLLFGTGPLTCTPAPTPNRFTVAARSPLTGLWGESDCGGRWASTLKGDASVSKPRGGAFAATDAALYFVEPKVRAWLVRSRQPYAALESITLDILNQQIVFHFPGGWASVDLVLNDVGKNA